MEILKKQMCIGLVLTCCVITICGNVVFADQATVLPTNTGKEPRISVDLPVKNANSSSPFDFILDPLKLIYATDAAKYGGGSVEEGATMLFRNSEGEYDFSNESDKLVVKNRSNIPIKLTISATVGNIDNVEMLRSNSYDDNDICSMYMALVDDDGNIVPVSENGTAQLEVEIDPVPDDTYMYKYDEKSAEYEYVLSKDESEIDWPVYSFGLTGSCNPYGKWTELSEVPYVEVSWKIEEIVNQPISGSHEEIVSENSAVFDDATGENTEFSESNCAQENSNGFTSISAPFTETEETDNKDPESEPGDHTNINNMTSLSSNNTLSSNSTLSDNGSGL